MPRPRFSRILLVLLAKELRLFRKHTAIHLLLGLIGIFGLLVSFSGSKPSPSLSIVFSPGGDKEFESYLMSVERDVRFRYSRPNETLKPRGFEVSVTIPEDLRRAASPLIARHSSRSSITGLAVRQILHQRAFEYLNIPLPVKIEVVDERGIRTDVAIPRPPERTATDARATKEITMLLLCTMTVMMCGLNLFSVVLSEEKSQKLLLAQLLSPASMPNVLVAKYLFYILVCCSVEAMLLSCYRPWLLSDPTFWAIILLGCVSYMSVASLIVMVTQKGSTANILTMGYVLLIGLVVLLSQDLPLFASIKAALPEMYIFSSLAALFDGRPLDQNIRHFALSAASLAIVALGTAHVRGLKAA